MVRQALAILGGALALGLIPVATWADTTTTQHLEHLMVENADTPAEHVALARYYRMKAADARSLAEEHQAMGKRYQGKPTLRRNMKKHCDRIAELNEELATEYEGLAAGEEEAAKE